MAARMEMIDTTIISSTKVNPPWWKGRRFADFIDILATMLILSRSCITPKHPALLRHLICRHDSWPVPPYWTVSFSSVIASLLRLNEVVLKRDPSLAFKAISHESPPPLHELALGMAVAKITTPFLSIGCVTRRSPAPVPEGGTRSMYQPNSVGGEEAE